MQNKMRWLLSAAVALAGLWGEARELTWNGAAGAVWNDTAPNWLDEGKPCAWEDGATAVFGDDGVVAVEGTIKAGGIRFAASGTALVGGGAIELSGAIDAAAGTENSISTRLNSAPAMTKTGPGTVALACARGSLSIAAGVVYAGGFNMRDLAVTIADGAALKAVSGGDKAATLLKNGSFEEPPRTGYVYISGNALSSWNILSASIIHMNDAGAKTWNSNTYIPDGAMMLAVQMGGSCAQTFTVEQDGFYDLSFIFFKRGSVTAYLPHEVYFSIDNALWQTFYSWYECNHPQRVDTGAIYLKAGSHTVSFCGEKNWGDTTSFIDDCVFAAPTLTDATAVPSTQGIAVNVPSGERTFDETYTLAADEHGFAYVAKTGAGKAIFTKDLELKSRTIYEVEGEVEYAGTISGAFNLHKRGTGTLTLTTPSSSAIKIENGNLAVKNATSGMSVAYRVDRGVTAGFYPGLAAGDVKMGNMTFEGDGICAIGTLGDGHTLTIPNLGLNSNGAVLDVGEGDRISVGKLYAVLVGNAKTHVETPVIKDGPGTLEVGSVPTDSYSPGSVLVRNGSYVVNFSDDESSVTYYRPDSSGNYTSKTYGLAEKATTPFVLGDRNSPADAAVAFWVNASSFVSPRPFVFNSQPATATLGVKAGTAEFTGTLTVNRARLNLASEGASALALGPIVKGADTAAMTLTLGENLALALNGVVDAGVSLVAEKAAGFNVGTDAVVPVTFDGFTFAGEATVDFDKAGDCDVVTADKLALGAVAFTLNDLLEGGAFAQPGRYVIARFTIFDGDAAAFTVANPVQGYRYAFAASGGELALTIATEESCPIYTWTGASGDWANAANWDHASVPNAAGRIVRFPRVAKAANAVALGGELVAGSLLFENANGVALTGGTLTLDAGAETPTIRVLNGSATISSTLAGSKPVTLLSEGDCLLTIDGVVTCDLLLKDGVNVRFGPNAQVKGRIVTSGCGTLDLASGGTVVDAVVKGLYGSFWRPATMTGEQRGKVANWREYKAWAEAGTFITRKLMDNPDGFRVDDFEANNLPEEVSGNTLDANRWVGIWEGVMTLPTAGRYGFKAACDDDYVLAIDGVNVCQTTNNCTALGYVTLSSGPHRIFLGLTDAAATAQLDVTVMMPDDTVQRLPLAWLSPDAEIASLAGKGTLEPQMGSALAVRQDVGFAAWEGALDGLGALVKRGAGEFATRVVSGSVVAAEGQFVANGAAEFDSLSVVADAKAVLPVGGAVRTLTGSGELTLGGAYAFRVTGDADCGISSGKKYTHLVNWTTAAFNEPVNGVRFTISSEAGYGVPLSENGNPGVVPQPEDTTPFRKMMRKLGLGNAKTNTLTISGLTAGKRYDFRFYLRPFGTCDRRFTHDFIVGGKTVGSIVWDPNRDAGLPVKNDAKIIEPMSVVGCRYTADASGSLTLRMTKYNMSDGNGFHWYAFSNEELPDETDETVTLNPERETVFDGDVTEGLLKVAGSAPQVFRGTISSPLVVEGEVVLDGGKALGGVNVDDDAVLELRPGATVGALTGAGAVKLTHGDAGDEFGELQPDGSFAAAAYPRRVIFNGDEDCGISSAKRYTQAWNFGAKDVTWPTVINGAQFAVLFRKSEMFDGRRMAALRCPGGGESSGSEPSWTPDFKSSQVYQMMRGMAYTGAKNSNFTFSNLTPGKDYEIRIYNRKWDSCARQCIYKYTVSGVEQVFDFNENDRTEPSYVALRIKPTTTFQEVLATSDQTKDYPHFYGATIEEVADYSRVLAAETDATFAGAISGYGAVRKRGAGVQTLTGAVTATGPWTVAEGGLLLDNADSTLANVAVRSGAKFGGTCTVNGNVGVVAGGTLDAAYGRLTILGKLALGEGATVAIACDKDGAGFISAAEATLPENLQIVLRAKSEGDVLPGAAKIMELPASFTGDVSKWQVSGDLKGIRSLKFYQNGRSVLMMRSGFILFLR